MFLLAFTKTSSMVQKTLNKSVQTLYTYWGGSKYQTSNDLVYPEFKSRNKHSNIRGLKDKKFPPGLYLMERRNTRLTIRKLLVTIIS